MNENILVGYKHLQGVSRRSGKDYDFYTLYLIDTNPTDPDVVGGTVYECNCSTPVFNKSLLSPASVNTKILVSYDRNGNLINIESKEG